MEDLGGDWGLLFNPESTGEDFYGTLSSLLGGDREASLLLNKAGIKGLRYLDGSSRGKGEGSHNFVIFDDSAVEILETFYQNRARQGPRGSVTIADHNYLINLFKGADLSTLLHETGHIFLAEVERVIEAGAADENLVADYEKIKTWLGRLDDDGALKEEYGRGLVTQVKYEQMDHEAVKVISATY